MRPRDAVRRMRRLRLRGGGSLVRDDPRVLGAVPPRLARLRVEVVRRARVAVDRLHPERRRARGGGGRGFFLGGIFERSEGSSSGRVVDAALGGVRDRGRRGRRAVVAGMRRVGVREAERSGRARPRRAAHGRERLLRLPSLAVVRLGATRRARERALGGQERGATLRGGVASRLDREAEPRGVLRLDHGARRAAAATRARDEVPRDGTESDEKDDEVYVIYPTP